MRLVDVYDRDVYGRIAMARPAATKILYQLLSERDPRANISHKEMPSFDEHVAFMALRPYEAWYLITADHLTLGAIYLTKGDEIGVSIFKAYQGEGYGSEAVKLLKALHPRKRYFANVAPANLPSQQFWLKNGFKPLQVVYEWSTI